jgi:hypothetical protein
MSVVITGDSCSSIDSLIESAETPPAPHPLDSCGEPCVLYKCGVGLKPGTGLVRSLNQPQLVSTLDILGDREFGAGFLNISTEVICRSCDLNRIYDAPSICDQSIEILPVGRMDLERNLKLVRGNWPAIPRTYETREP